MNDKIKKICDSNGAINIVQIGANKGNLGSDTVWNLSKTTKEMFKAHLIEPLPHLFNQLVKNYSDFPHVKCHNIAISTTEQETLPIYYISEEDAKKYNCPWFYEGLGSSNSEHIQYLIKNSVLNDKNNLKHVPKTIYNAPCQTLNNFIKRNNITNVDFLQLDVEGFDGQIILSYNFHVKPKLLQFEYVHIDEPYKGRNSKTLTNVIKHLKSFGYEMLLENSNDMLFELK